MPVPGDYSELPRLPEDPARGSMMGSPHSCLSFVQHGHVSVTGTRDRKSSDAAPRAPLSLWCLISKEVNMHGIIKIAYLYKMSRLAQSLNLDEKELLHVLCVL